LSRFSLFHGEEAALSIFKRLVERTTDQNKPRALEEALPPKAQPASNSSDKSSTAATESSAEWREVFENASQRESTRKPLMAFVGSWPKDIEARQLSSSAWLTLARNKKCFLTIPYPLVALKSMPDAPRPDCRMVDGKIARASLPFIDMFLFQVLPVGKLANAEPHVLVCRFIEQYFTWPQARLLFLFPEFQDVSQCAIDGKTAVLIIKDLLVQVYKGVENAIFRTVSH